jgi:hypothetical protein
MDGGVGGLDASHRVVAIKGPVAGTAVVIGGSSPGTEVSMIGQSGAIITSSGPSTANLTVDGINAYVRAVTITLSDGVGLVVRNDATLRLASVNVTNNAGGGLLIDASGFDIRDSTFSSNGPGDAMGAAWGGIRIQGAAAPTPRVMSNVTITSNRQVGLSCSMQITASAVFVAGNIGGVDVSPTCGITPCQTAGPDCGAP